MSSISLADRTTDDNLQAARSSSRSSHPNGCVQVVHTAERLWSPYALFVASGGLGCILCRSDVSIEPRSR